jgi:hypothetical protein
MPAVAHPINHVLPQVRKSLQYLPLVVPGTLRKMSGDRQPGMGLKLCRTYSYCTADIAAGTWYVDFVATTRVLQYDMSIENIRQGVCLRVRAHGVYHSAPTGRY